jgi:hypothetical protein
MKKYVSPTIHNYGGLSALILIGGIAPAHDLLDLRRLRL